MSLNKRLHVFLVEREGGRNLFDNVGWITASAGLFYIGKKMLPGATAIGWLTLLFALSLFTLGYYIGTHNFLIPFMRVFYGRRHNRKKAFSMPRIIYTLLSMLYVRISVEWFDIIANSINKQ